MICKVWYTCNIHQKFGFGHKFKKNKNKIWCWPGFEPGTLSLWDLLAPTEPRRPKEYFCSNLVSVMAQKNRGNAIFLHQMPLVSTIINLLNFRLVLHFLFTDLVLIFAFFFSIYQLDVSWLMKNLLILQSLIGTWYMIAIFVMEH